jgi:hypothetical protein
MADDKVHKTIRELGKELGLKPTEPPYAAFRDDQGRPTLTSAAVLFLDLLGTNEVRDDKAALDHLIKTHRALARARAAGGSGKDDQILSVATWFSDNLALAYPISQGLDPGTALGLAVTDAANHQISLAYDGMFSRGGLASGGFYSDENFIFGPALNRAVGLEHERAKWPRVVLDETSIQVARTSLSEDEGGSGGSPWRAQLLVDEDGIVFVNYLSSLEFYEEELDSSMHALARHAERIRRNLELHDGNNRVHDKYRWLATYHDHFLAGFTNQELVDRLYLRPSRPLGSFRSFAEDIPIPDEGEFGAIRSNG